MYKVSYMEYLYLKRVRLCIQTLGQQFPCAVRSIKAEAGGQK